MPIPRSGLAIVIGLLAAISAVGGCGSPASSVGDTSAAPYLLQARSTQALPPEQRFEWVPSVTITTDRVLVTGGAVPAIFPGPLLTHLRGQAITASGFERIVAEAQAAGLFDDSADPGAPPPGGQMAEVDLWVDGAMRTIRGDPTRVMQCVRAPCGAPPGTPEAFGAFLAGIHDLASVMPEELGPDDAFVPDAYALLIGVPPLDDMDLGVQVLEWPLADPLGLLGEPIGPEPFPRCATVAGDDAAVVGPLLAGANQLTQWADDGAAPIVLRARPILAGENPCRDLFGVQG
jgi:hypothetical protein